MRFKRVHPKHRVHKDAPGAMLEALESRRLLSAALGNVVLHNDLQILKNSTNTASIQGFTPSQVEKAYSFSNLTFANGTVKADGSGQTIAIVDAFNDPYIQTDLGVFDQQFGLNAPPSFKVVNQSGGSKLPANNAGWAGEESLDVEWAHAIAPGANIILVEASSATLTNLLAAVNFSRHDAGVSAVSMSWGGSEFFSFNGTEFTGETTLDPTFTTPSGHNGVTFVASAGDSGTFSGVQWPAVSPNVLSVGGTSLYTASDGTYQKEYSWIGTSGGYSQIETTPTYQDSVDFAGTRSSPDVAYVADPNTGVAVFDSYPDAGYVGWQVVGGTSVGAPQWAALVAIANQGRALSGMGTLDGPSQTLPMLYSLYGKPGTSAYTTYTDYFHDVIDPRGFFDAATAGYDQLTGMGTPKADVVVDALAGITPGSQPINPAPPTPPMLSPSPIEATIVSSLPSAVVGSTFGEMTLRLFNSSSSNFSGALSVALYATTDGSIASSDTPFATITVKHVSIASNAAINEVVHFRYPTSVPNGAYQFAAAVTAVGTDTAAADAVASAATTVSAPTVDLSETALKSAVRVSPGSRKFIKLRIANKGNFIASGILTLSLYSSTDKTLDSTDPLITSLARTISILPGHSQLLDLRFIAPASLTAGSYNLIAAASSSVRPPDVNAGDKIVVIATKA